MMEVGRSIRFESRAFSAALCFSLLGIGARTASPPDCSTFEPVCHPVVRSALHTCVRPVEQSVPMRVLAMRDGLKVFRIHAGRILTEMIQHHPVRYRTDLNLVHRTVGQNQFSSRSHHLSVPAWRSGSKPLETSGVSGSASFQKFPKQCRLDGAEANRRFHVHAEVRSGLMRRTEPATRADESGTGRPGTGDDARHTLIIGDTTW